MHQWDGDFEDYKDEVRGCCQTVEWSGQRSRSTRPARLIPSTCLRRSINPFCGALCAFSLINPFAAPLSQLVKEIAAEMDAQEAEEARRQAERDEKRRLASKKP